MTASLVLDAGPLASSLSLADLPQQFARLRRIRQWGRLDGVRGAALSVSGLGRAVALGDRVVIERHDEDLPGEVVAFAEDNVTVMPEGRSDGLVPGARVTLAESPVLYPCFAWLGRVVDGLGHPVDDRGPLPQGIHPMPLRRAAPAAFRRHLMGQRLETGLRVLDTFVPLCRGQRLGVFAASGVGKSTLMGMLARFVAADVIVVGLIGERGRELREFLDVILGEEGLRRTVVVVATSDQPALARRRAAQATLSVAEWFRDQGKQVLCLLDSVTRLAHAQREIGLAAGEPATARSYTPSVFAELPALLERAGPGVGEQGDITAIFTVLVDGDDHDEPVADAVRGILDGHLVLDRRIGERGRWPAIDVLRSVSRALPRCHSDAENGLLAEARRLLDAYERMAEMIRLGAYRAGSDPMVDVAIEKHPTFEAFLGQKTDERMPAGDAFAALARILDRAGPPTQPAQPAGQAVAHAR
ncbi:FliI/YscN family ATPase [Rhodopila globiformis]|uniref:Flagellum-specific ATP synthase FliI n=1 Tax=Rhodopila globiformis TaxID=1071 RepID=A0A2S6MZI4_RHOGL|nr:FliI/YscN family ATPase [Rhodopila globiformis]PPQ27771.1 flagellum-specific ATP synthase FliI [Rhodopila globiformis]